MTFPRWGAYHSENGNTYCKKLNSNVICFNLDPPGELRKGEKRQKVKVWVHLAWRSVGFEYAFLVKSDITMLEMVFKLYMCLILYSTEMLILSEVQRKSGHVPKKALPLEEIMRLWSFCISQRQPTDISYSNNRRTPLQKNEQQECLC